MNSPAAFARFLRWFLTISVGGLLLVGLFNLLVDPYDRFGLNRLGVYVSASREYKLRQAGRQPHDALLVGNSRIAQIPAAELRGRRFFNAGMDGASLREVELFLERNLRPHELVVLNLDHYALGFESDLEPAIAFAPLTPHTLGNYLLNPKTIEYSVRTISKHLAGKPPIYGPDGTTGSAQWRLDRDRDDPAWTRAEIATQSGHAAGFRLDAQRLVELRRLQQLVQERQGQLIVFFSPVHEDVLPALESGTAAVEWKRAVREVTALFPGAVDLTHSSFSNRTNYARTDPVHYFPEVGLRILNELVLPRGPSPMTTDLAK
jgi:hypothetical protein